MTLALQAAPVERDGGSEDLAGSRVTVASYVDLSWPDSGFRELPEPARRTSRARARSFPRSSSVKRFSRAAHDAGGLGMAANLRADAASAVADARSTNGGISLIGVAEGVSGQIGALLTRSRELAIQGASEALESTERRFIQNENASRTSEINHVAAVTEFSSKLPADGSGTSVSVPVGINVARNLESRSTSTFRPLWTSIPSWRMLISTASRRPARLPYRPPLNSRVGASNFSVDCLLKFPIGSPIESVVRLPGHVDHHRPTPGPAL